MPRHLIRNFSSCLVFDGVDDVVTVTHQANLSLTDNVTITAWIMPMSFGEGNLGAIVAKGSAGFSTGYMLGMRNNTGQRTLRFTGTNTTYESSSTNIITLGRWQHVAVTFDKNAGSNQVKFYVNGAAAGTATKSNSLTTDTSNLGIGNSVDTTRTFDGMIDEVKIYNVTLTAAQIEAECYRSQGGTTGLVLYHKFDEGSGSTANDSSSGANAGTITGATYSTDVFIKPRVSVS